MNNPNDDNCDALWVAQSKCLEWPTQNRRAKYAPLYLFGCAMGRRNTNCSSNECGTKEEDVAFDLVNIT